MLNGGGPQNEPSTCRGVVEVIYGGLFRGPIGIVVKRCLNFELEHIFKLLEKKSRGTFFLYFSSTSSFLILLLLGFFCSAKACGRLDHKIRTYVICVYDYFSSIFPLPFLLSPLPPAHNWCSFVTSVTWIHRRVVLWDWELMYFQVYVYIIFVYRVVYVDMSTRSSQINHLSLEKIQYNFTAKCQYIDCTSTLITHSLRS